MYIYFSLSILEYIKLKKILILNKISSTTQKEWEDFSMYFSLFSLNYLLLFVLYIKLPLSFPSDTQSQAKIFHK